jgi:hemoglobin
MNRRALLCGALVLVGCGRHPAPAAEPSPAAAPQVNIERHPRAVPPFSPADPPPRVETGIAPAMPAAPAPAPASLYARLGGADAIRAVVDTMVTRVVADERINAFFRGVDLEQLKRLLAEQICQATGGPCAYSGRPMRVAHRGLALTDANFNALVGDLIYALNRCAVPAPEQHDLLTALAALRPEIVGQ